MTMRFAPRLLWAAMPALVLTAPAAADWRRLELGVTTRVSFVPLLILP